MRKEIAGLLRVMCGREAMSGTILHSIERDIISVWPLLAILSLMPHTVAIKSPRVIGALPPVIGAERTDAITAPSLLAVTAGVIGYSESETTTTAIHTP